MSVTAEKGSNVLAMGVVEDFIYLNRISSTNTLQIWLRRTQQKVGRLSAGSKITSLLTANDIVFSIQKLESLRDGFHFSTRNVSYITNYQRRGYYTWRLIFLITMNK